MNVRIKFGGEQEMNFSEKIYMIRNKSALSQDEMAHKFGVSRQTISKWESGLSYPELDKIIKISETFHVSLDWLLKNTQKELISDDNLQRAALQFLGISQDMEKISNQIVEIIRDATIDDIEKIQLKESLSTLEQVIENLIQIRKLVSDTKTGGKE